MRTIIDLGEAQLKELEQICSREGISRAEAIRRAVDAYAREQATDLDDEAFGLWKDRAEDGLTYQKRMRKEWDR